MLTFPPTAEISVSSSPYPPCVNTRRKLFLQELRSTKRKTPGIDIYYHHYLSSLLSFCCCYYYCHHHHHHHHRHHYHHHYY